MLSNWVNWQVAYMPGFEMQMYAYYLQQQAKMKKNCKLNLKKNVGDLQSAPGVFLNIRLVEEDANRGVMLFNEHLQRRKMNPAVNRALCIFVLA